jgi:hypothetical protein
MVRLARAAGGGSARGTDGGSAGPGFASSWASNDGPRGRRLGSRLRRSRGARPVARTTARLWRHGAGQASGSPGRPASLGATDAASPDPSLPDSHPVTRRGRAAALRGAPGPVGRDRRSSRAASDRFPWPAGRDGRRSSLTGPWRRTGTWPNGQKVTRLAASTRRVGDDGRSPRPGVRHRMNVGGPDSPNAHPMNG